MGLIMLKLYFKSDPFLKKFLSMLKAYIRNDKSNLYFFGTNSIFMVQGRKVSKIK